MNQTNKVILKTAAWGTFWTIVAVSYVFGIFAFAFPQQMADLSSAMGNKELCAKYTERVYQNKLTSENIYIVLDKYIVAGDNEKIIKYSELLFNKPDYTTIINKVDSYKTEQAGEMATIFPYLFDENGRLQAAYTNALMVEKGLGAATEYYNSISSTLSSYYQDYISNFLGI